MGRSVEIFDTDFSQDPGIKFTSDAQARRDYDGINERWVADFFRRDSPAAWAYIPIPVPLGDLTIEDRWSFALRHYVFSSSPDAVGFVGFHRDPEGQPAPDVAHFIGYVIQSIAGTVKIRPWYIRSNGSGSGGSGVTISPLPRDVLIEVSFEPTTRQLTVDVYDIAGPLIGSDSVIVDQALAPVVKVFGTRDGGGGTVPTDLITGWIDDLSIAMDFPDDSWVLSIFSDNPRSLPINTVGTWNDPQPPIVTRVTAQGRNWQSRYHDGAEVLSIILTGILLGELDDLEITHRLIRTAETEGTIVELHSPEPDYSLADAQVDLWDSVRKVAQLTFRQYTLIVQSRRKPDRY